MSANLDEKLLQMRATSIRAKSPERKNGFELGDAVRLPCIDTTFEVIGLSDESLVDLRAPSGRILRAGWRVLSRVKTHNPDGE